LEQIRKTPVKAATVTPGNRRLFAIDCLNVTKQGPANHRTSQTDT